ncbi:putative tellurium resistance membrane protein TerC [Desulfobaculum xiamenense]|uniref:Putative tellurium resistance membrane protein TerC n=1 Tax=Desulfobaculum xiamenense TaxID=995050 RepID=A0A846QWC1_9BACT|nr:TerC family protein [Desulfobaculum xiamenense]NJB69404.1 putative tellurium resistance membrane protein TerC [Desulfobaculum xiamenense]
MLDLLTLENAVALATLSALEIVLGIDNIVFIAVITNRLPAHIRNTARRLGLGLAMGSRILLLLGIAFIMKLSTPLFTLFDHAITGRDLVLLGGGLFLLAKATFEIHEKLEDPARKDHIQARGKGLVTAMVQIVVLDLVFSLDSVITAVGMARSIEVMIAAIVVAVGVMMLFAGPVSDFVARHPTMQMLAFSFLLLVGVLLVAEGMGKHLDRGYVYFAMAFSLFVEVLNLRMQKARATQPR